METPELFFLNRALIAIVLFISGYAKLSDLENTQENLIRYGFIPKKFIDLGKFLLPLIEISLGLLLLIPNVYYLGAAGSFMLFTLFLIALSIALSRKQNLTCGCFGQWSKERVTFVTIARAGFFALASLLVFFDSFLSSVDKWIRIFNLLLVVSGYSLILLPALNNKKNMGKNKKLSNRDYSGVSRRDLLKVLLAGFLAVSFQPIRNALAINCCYCKYQHHYDPISSCCGAYNGFALHHYWRRCYNGCTGQLGSIHLIYQDCNSCECGACSDSSWTTVDECCYAWECCCGYECVC